jgi:hypothetical protein
LIGYEAFTSAPALSTLTGIPMGVESELPFRCRNIEGVAQRKQHAEREKFLTFNRNWHHQLRLTR